MIEYWILFFNLIELKKRSRRGSLWLYVECVYRFSVCVCVTGSREWRRRKNSFYCFTLNRGCSKTSCTKTICQSKSQVFHSKANHCEISEFIRFGFSPYLSFARDETTVNLQTSSSVCAHHCCLTSFLCFLIPVFPSHNSYYFTFGRCCRLVCGIGFSSIIFFSFSMPYSTFSVPILNYRILWSC